MTAETVIFSMAVKPLLMSMATILGCAWLVISEKWALDVYEALNEEKHKIVFGGWMDSHVLYQMMLLVKVVWCS